MFITPDWAFIYYLNPWFNLTEIMFLGVYWFCKNDLFWLLDIPKDLSTYKVMDSTRMTCGGYKYIGKPVIPVLRILNVSFINI